MKSRILLFAVPALVLSACGGRSSQNTTTQALPTGEAVVPTVEVTVAAARDVADESTYASTVEAYAVNNIAPQTAARIRKINVEVGDYVSKGQVLAEMDRLQLDQLALQLKNTETEYGRLKSLYEEGGVSASDFESVQLNYEVMKSNYANVEENTILRSPISGYVTARNFDKGDLYSMSAPLFTVQQVVPVKMLVGISESEYSKVRRGDAVTLTADALPGRTFTGKVERIYPTVNAATHTVSVEITVPNTDRVLRPGMYTRVTVTFGTNHRVVVPDQAIVRQEGTGQRFVYILKEDGTVSYVPVTPGRHMGGEYEIVEGIAEGETVVVKGQATLKDGVKVQVLNK